MNTCVRYLTVVSVFLLCLGRSVVAADELLEERFSQLDTNRWKIEGRGESGVSRGVLRLTGCEAAAGDAAWTDYELSFRARAPRSADHAQIWASVRRMARDSRYAIGIRGGNNNQVYIARYAPNGRQAFLGVKHLAESPRPGKWQHVRIAVTGQTIKVYLNHAKEPVMEATDSQAGALTAGGISLGGGFLPTEYEDVRVTGLVPGQPAQMSVSPPAMSADRSGNEEKRRRLRAEYRPAKVKMSDAPRTEVSLDGKWLFLPSYEFVKGVDYAAPNLDDAGWHVMDVPALWTRLDNWCYADSEAVSGSDNWVVMERERLARYSFDWKRTQSAWYRHSFDIAALPEGKRFELCFEAIAKVAEIWVNGRLVGRNYGMFRPAQFDISPWVKPGRNLIAVRVGAVSPDEVTRDGDKVAAVAVTVAVTQSMLGSIPQGIYNGRPAGIWQPVKLVVRPQVHVKDVFFQPRLDGAKVELTLENQSDRPCQVLPALAFTSILPGHEHLGRALAPSSAAAASGVAALPDHGKSIMSRLITLAAHACTNVTIDTGFLEVKPWSPAEPNLYTLCVAFQADGQIVDERKLDVGFRTFEARRDGQFYLNGKPYWLAGGNATPMPNCPNDAAMAGKFTRIMHEARVRTTRTHTAPWNELWLSCADRNGVGVSQEGTWPWLMIGGNMPNARLIECWREENLALVKKTRNHPSILFWTINNESYYPSVTNAAKTEEMMTILTATIKEMRAADPTRPICPDSGGVYKMFPAYYAAMAKEKGFDYGDIDDKHDYTGWYHKTFFQHYPGQKYVCGQTGIAPPEQMRYWITPGRPLISQEMATGYPNADDGHAIRRYIFSHLVPQIWVGDYAYEHHDPRHLLASIALNTKELTETVRCYYHGDLAGVLNFAYNTWFQNPFEVDRIRPYEPALALAKALQPVLVSARLFGRHFYAGAHVAVNGFVVNDDDRGTDLGPTRLSWSVEHLGHRLAGGEQAVPAVPYYGKQAFTLDLQLPDALPQPRVDAKLVLRLLEGKKLISSNDYDLVLAEKAWAAVSASPRVISVFDPSRASEPLWATLGVTPRWLEAIPSGGLPRSLVVCGYDWVADSAQRARFLEFISAGGHVLLLGPGQHLKALFPEVVSDYRKRDGEVVNMRVPESPVFDGIEVLDLRWFDRGDRSTPIACHGDYVLRELPAVEVLAKHNPTHAYLFKKEELATQEGAVIFSLRQGKGQAWVSELAHETAVRDPVAARVLRNMVNAAERKRE